MKLLLALFWGGKLWLLPLLFTYRDSKDNCFANTVTRTRHGFPMPSPPSRTRTTNFIYYYNMVIQKS